ncbi:MAG: tetratricopeptide repeat protein [Cyclobacteriaceae bacterium]|nr:tetratricopeptide repeat protein [Cyclobacteriaceae bacterium]
MKIGIVIIFCLICFHLPGQTPRVDQAKKLYEAKKFAEVIQLLKPVDDDEKDYPAAQYYLGRVAFDKKEYDDAADYFSEASDEDQTKAEYFTWLGNAYGNIARDANVMRQGILAPKMRNAWEKAITLDSKNIDARSSLIQYYTQAPGFMGGSFDKAKEMANQIMKLNPAQGHLQMGNILVSEKKIPQAEKEFIEMVKIDPLYVTGLANFYLNQKQYDKAFSLYEEKIKQNPDDYAAIYQYGRLSALSNQRLDRGEEYLKKYMTYTPKQNEPSIAAANMRMGQIIEKKGNKAEAKKYYETALKGDATLKDAQDGLQRTSK